MPCCVGDVVRTSVEHVDATINADVGAVVRFSPSGAHCQPWTFVVVQSKRVKHDIRLAVEAEEQLNYDRRMRRTWVADVNPFVDNLHNSSGEVLKPYLDDAPFLIIVMKQVGRGGRGHR